MERPSEWARATKPALCPKCGEHSQITKEQDGAWHCACCAHTWRV